MGTRDRILDAGVDLLQTQGIAALTQPRVAKAAGLTQSHLTYYFPTRNDLLIAIAEAAIAHMLTTLGRPGAAGERSLGERIGAVVPPLAIVRLMLGLIVAADEEPALRSALDTLIHRIRQGIGGLLRGNGIEAPPEQTLLVHATFIGLSVMNLARQNEASAAEVTTGVNELMRLLAADSAQRSAP